MGLSDKRQHVEQRVEVTNRSVNVHGLDGIAAPDVNGVEAVAQLQEILKVAMISGPTPPFAIE